MGMIFQEPQTSLNPVMNVGKQIAESVRLHDPRARDGVQARVVALLRAVGIPDPEQRSREYPHQLSGGMKQRVMIAMALAGEPGLLIADEPTTALDVTIEAQILRLLKEAQARLGMGLLLISHDLSVVSKVCERIVVLYGGRVVETGLTQDILTAPKHPYTRGLLGSRLSVDDRRHSLRPIPGEVPEATEWPEGCRFHPRCREVLDRCREDEPSLRSVDEAGKEGDRVAEREVRCWLYPEPGGAP
jgi:oligopeptide/dipeptide ABC transporter ATP-binding protein